MVIGIIYHNRTAVNKHENGEEWPTESGEKAGRLKNRLFILHRPILPKPLNLHLRFIRKEIKHGRAKMTKNRIVELVNKDGKLLALFSGLLLDGILLIALIVFIGMYFVI